MKHLSAMKIFCSCGILTLMSFVSMTSATVPSIKLSSGYDMPVVGLGTWQLEPDNIDTALTSALESGYRHIDTAYVYQNEEAIGKSLKKWMDKGGKREELFITTKLPPLTSRLEDVERALNISLKRLGLSYVDMYLIHAPTTFKADENLKFLFNEDGEVIIENPGLENIWKEMERQVECGRARSIGISNFNESQVLRIVKSAKIHPSNLQIELHAYNQQIPLRELCSKHNISVTAYSSLGSYGTTGPRTNFTKGLPKLIEHEVVKNIAKKHNKTSAQVLLRHLVQLGLIVIPKSKNPERIRENINIFDFELSNEDMKEMEGLNLGEIGRFFDFSFFKGINKHPEYPFWAQIELQGRS